MSELYVVLCSDTEDNYPNYVPGWASLGSDYDKNPALIRWDWVQYWDGLNDLFNQRKIPITWLIRVDDGPIRDIMLKRFRSKILKLKSQGDEVGIHIHTFFWDPNSSRWRQTKNSIHEVTIVDRSLRYFRETLGFSPASVRMGWNAMSNAIMRTLEDQGILVDATCVPGCYCDGKFGKRDNIFNWKRAPTNLYHPSQTDYQSLGDMRILEMPLATLTPSRSRLLEFITNTVSSSKVGHELLFMSSLARRLGINQHPFFYISPWWSTSPLKRIADIYAQIAREKGFVFLTGSFHAADILDPRTGSVSRAFKSNLEETVRYVSNIKGVEVKFSTLSKAVKIYARRILG